MIDKFLGTPNQIRKYFGLKEIKNQQEQKIEELENIINKAIEYIDDIAPWEEKTEDGDIIKGKLIQDDYVDILLDILKGVDKE